jgi:hypothetical protein
MTLVVFLYWLMIPVGYVIALTGLVDRLDDILRPPTKRTIIKRKVMVISGWCICLLGIALFGMYSIINGY